MKFFVDTGNIEDIRRLHALGIVDGVTTNPSLMAKETRDPRDILKEICDLVQGPVSGEVVATDVDGMLREGRDLPRHLRAHRRQGALHARRRAGLPNPDRRGHARQRHAVLLAAQALLAAKVGAYFVSPFVGRLDDIGHDGMDLIEQIVEIYDNYDFATEVLVASTRGPGHIVEAAARRRRLHVPAVGPRCPLQAPADRHRPGAIPRRLGESAAEVAHGPREPVCAPGRARTAGRPRRRRRAHRQAARGRQADGARAHRAAARPGTPSRSSTARRPPLPRLRHGDAADPRRRRRLRPRPGRRPRRSSSSRRTSPCSAARSRKPTPRRSARSWTWR